MDAVYIEHYKLVSPTDREEHVMIYRFDGGEIRVDRWHGQYQGDGYTRTVPEGCAKARVRQIVQEFRAAGFEVARAECEVRVPR